MDAPVYRICKKGTVYSAGEKNSHPCVSIYQLRSRGATLDSPCGWFWYIIDSRPDSPEQFLFESLYFCSGVGFGRKVIKWREGGIDRLDTGLLVSLSYGIQPRNTPMSTVQADKSSFLTHPPSPMIRP